MRYLVRIGGRVWLKRERTTRGIEQVAKVLLIAYACDADDVSETWCSWQWTSRLAARHDATVLVYNKRRRAGAARVQLPGARVIEWTELPFLEKAPTFTHTLKPGYIDFYIRARRKIRHLLATERFDLIHQYEPFAPRYPSPAAGLGVPFILGPVGGGVESPRGFERELATEMPWFTRLRALDRWRFRHDPLLRHTYASADLVLGIAPYVREMLSPVKLKRFELFHETGVDALPPPRQSRGVEKGTLKLLYVGRVVRSKGVRDAVRAVAELRDFPGVTLDIVGDGGDRAACEREAARLGVGARVHFHGWQPHEVVERFYHDADVFVFPSLREASGQVVIEAMSHGLAMVVAANGGPGFTVGNKCGLSVQADSPALYATALAAALRRLAVSPELVEAFGKCARARVAKEFLWDRKVERMSEFYEEVLSCSPCAAGNRVSDISTAASAAFGRL